MQSVQDSDGGVGVTEKMCTLHSVIGDCVVVLSLREFVVWGFSVRRPRGGSSVILLSSYEVDRFCGLHTYQAGSAF